MTRNRFSKDTVAYFDFVKGSLRLVDGKTTAVQNAYDEAEAKKAAAALAEGL